MVVMPDFSAAHAAEKTLGVVCVRLSIIPQAVGFLMVDAMQRVAGMERVPASRLIGIQRSFRRDTLANEGERIGFIAEHAGQRLAAALTDHNHNLALAELVDGLAPILAIFAAIGRL